MLPFFYIPAYEKGQPEILLEEDSSRHIVQVLRMKTGESLQLTDGKGHLLTAAILEDHKKKCRVKVENAAWHPPREKKVTIALSLLKNANRFEWFLEKATEIGVSAIFPLLCERTEKQHFRQDRMQQLLISAMLQSQQCWLPGLPPPIPLTKLIASAEPSMKYIAHCLEEEKKNLADTARNYDLARSREQGADSGSLILIGPEGDFSPKEISLAMQAGFIPVTLGATRLRSETAGVVAAALLCT